MNILQKIINYHYIKLLLFYLICALFLLLEYMPQSNYVLNIIKPNLIASFLFYFYIYQQNKISYLLIFIISLIYDSLTNHYIGSSALCFFLTLAIFEYQKKIFYFNHFHELWLAYIIFLAEFLLLKTIITYYLNTEIVSISDLLLSAFTSGLFYPILHNLYYFTSQLIDDNK